jgi:hypothetical protein
MVLVVIYPERDEMRKSGRRRTSPVSFAARRTFRALAARVGGGVGRVGVRVGPVGSGRGQGVRLGATLRSGPGPRGPSRRAAADSASDSISRFHEFAD